MQVVHFIVGLFFVTFSFCIGEGGRVGWQNGVGLWGKRSVPIESALEEQQYKRNNENWRKLNSLWGKRSAPTELLFKRAEPAQWQMASGLWGRK